MVWGSEQGGSGEAGFCVALGLQKRLDRPCGAAALESQWLRVAEHAHVDLHAEQRRQHEQAAAVRHDQHRRGLGQRGGERDALAVDELLQRLAALGLAGPVDVGRRGADQRAEVPLAQAGVGRGRERRAASATVCAVTCARGASLQTMLRIGSPASTSAACAACGQADFAQRLVGGLEDAQRIAAGLAVAQEVEVVAGRRDRLGGGQLHQQVEARGLEVGGTCEIHPNLGRRRVH